MYVINSSGDVLNFNYKNTAVTLRANEIFPVEIFDIHRLQEVRELVGNGYLTFYDDEEPEGFFNFNANFETQERKVINTKKGLFNNTHFEE